MSVSGVGDSCGVVGTLVVVDCEASVVGDVVVTDATGVSAWDWTAVGDDVDSAVDIAVVYCD